MSVLHETFISNTKFYMMNLIWLAKATDEPTLQKVSCKKYLAKIVNRSKDIDIIHVNKKKSKKKQE